MKKYFLPLFTILFTLSISSVYAITVVTCTGTSESPCPWPKIFESLRNLITVILSLIVVFAFIRIALLGLKYGMNADKAEVRTEFRNNFLAVLLATIALVALIPLTSYSLKVLKVNDSVTKPLDCLQDKKDCAKDGEPMFKLNLNPFPKAYAADLFPETVNVGGNIFDYTFVLFELVLRICFIGLIIQWFYAGFSLIVARGNPTELEKAKNRLWFVVTLTVILMLVQVFLVALKGTISN